MQKNKCTRLPFYDRDPTNTQNSELCELAFYADWLNRETILTVYLKNEWLCSFSA